MMVGRWGEWEVDFGCGVFGDTSYGGGGIAPELGGERRSMAPSMSGWGVLVQNMRTEHNMWGVM